MITLVDYGVGNPAAIVNMFRHIGVACVLTSDPEAIAGAERVMLPGVGHYDHCYGQLESRGLLEPLQVVARQRKQPFLGICVGAQLLGHASEEGEAPGLGWLDFTVRRLPGDAGVRVPHMGWSEVTPERQDAVITATPGRLPRFYFAHSYYMDPQAPTDAMASTDYGIRYTAAVQSENVVGVQFHPEKSHRYGMDFLRSFAAWSP